ncbi:toxin-antitoxin system, antitoxin component, ribbon-helix-helix domain protein [Leptospira weilii serovar Topaz str. LT2116]|uniref:Toxin-antitoxin system, antitoxin component, ribbon-helix-helix domain protein n=1 Tax=Leptospira weilii serovar Topaz str. LT2116 TaxID=1088540 RepID=M3G4J2_9LEPT|nr:toxin-antitoxin system, antitoxin component, ribbon-helix-helix domain protein [Leptospira weilii serovar Topaz str. LT2116]EMJ66452.1 toxin-antitoxin system, antitoxin component, ribbon-helix-helix domain protein [Leptospira sp. P2653]
MALIEFIKRHKQKDILKFINSVEYDRNYDYKEARNKR